MKLTLQNDTSKIEIEAIIDSDQLLEILVDDIIEIAEDNGMVQNVKVTLEDNEKSYTSTFKLIDFDNLCSWVNDLDFL
jgi:hypothetical protein